MTIKELMEYVDRMVPNQLEHIDKLQWLNDVEGLIYREIILTHVGAADIPYTKYDSDTDPDTPLLAPEPYCDVYRFYLESKVAQANGEMNRYNNAATSFNAAWQTFQDYWNRTHMPIQRAKVIKVV